MGKLSVKNSEVPVQIGSEKEKFFCSDLTLHRLTDDVSNDLTNTAREAKTPRHILTINEGLEGQTYPGTNVEYRRRTFTVNGEKVEGVFPRFESKFDTTLPQNLLNASDTEQFKSGQRHQNIVPKWRTCVVSGLVFLLKSDFGHWLVFISGVIQ